MVLSLFDTQLLERVLAEKFPGKQEFSRTELIVILNEMTKAEKYYPRGKITKGQKYKIFKYFVRYCLYRNLANFDTMVLLTGDKGVGKSSFAIMLAREWCRLLGINFSSKHHIAYSNNQVQELIDNLPRFHPCVTGTTKVYVKSPDFPFPYHEKINKLVGRDDFEILSYNFKNKVFEFLKPKACIQTKKRATVYEVELENGKKIRVTEDHEFLLQTGEYKALKDLREGDEVVLYSEKCLSCGSEFIPRRHDVKFCSKKCNDRHRFIDAEKNKRYRKYQKEYRVENKERLINVAREYRHKYKLRIQASKKIYRIKNRDKIIAKWKKYYSENREKVLSSNKKWRQNNKDKIREYMNKRHARLIKTSSEYKIVRNLRRRINLALKDQGIIKDKSLEQYIGCSISFLKKHLSSLFEEGMSWDNYGMWHVDHIVPCASFDLSLESQQKICFNYKNLQPLWARDNLCKGVRC